MRAEQPCPDPDTLERLLLGSLLADQTGPLERHVAACPHCLEVIRRVTTEDGLVRAVRAGGRSWAIPPEEADPALIARLYRLHRTADTAGPHAGLTPAGDPDEELAGLLGPARAPDEIGSVGPYGVLRTLGRGGMGVVFAARQERPRRLVALKVLPAAAQAGRQRLARFHGETEIIARLQHPHIVQVYEVGQHAGRPYFTMEYLDGGSLAGRLAAAPLAPRAAAELAETLARAVHFAHERGVVHRDLKPANVLLTADGTPKVADFGLAKQLGGEPRADATDARTESGAILGTPGYMAPEQAEGKKEVGPAADVYALGAMLYECLTGRPPFKAATVLETLDQVRSQEPVPIRYLQPKVPRDLQTVCLKCLEKAPARRYASATALADDLGRFLRGEPIRARPVLARERLWKWAQRKPALAALIVVSGLSLTTLVAGGLVYQARLRAEVAHARKERERADTDYRSARDALDRMLHHLERRRMGEVPELKELQRDQCEDALAFYQGILAGADDPDPTVRLDAARAYHRAATIQALLGRGPDAVRSYGRAIDLAEALPEAQRDLPETQDLLAACYGDRGLLSGDPAERKRDVGKALAIHERLAREKPDDPERQNGVATSEHQLGHILINASRWADAEPHVARAVAIRTRLVQDHPQEESYQEALAGDYVNLGVVYGALHRGAEGAGVYEKLEALLRPLIARHPEDVRQSLTLAAAEINGGLGLGAKGQKQAAIARCTEAVELAEAALRREPSYSRARATALDAHGARAQNEEALGRWAEAVKDWDRVIELDGGTGRWVHRVLRTMDLASAGEHVRAAAEADDLVRDPAAVGEGLWGLAIAYGRSYRAAKTDTRLPTAARNGLTERYASAAIACLRKLQREGFFTDAAHARWLSTDPDWQPLRGREDFGKLLEAVTGKRQG